MTNNLKAYDKAFIHYINGEYDMLTDKEKEIFMKELPDMEPKHISLRDICGGLGIEVPEKFMDIADDEQKIAFRSKAVKKDDVCLIIRSAEEFEAWLMTTQRQYEEAIENGAKLIIMGRKAFENAGLDEKNFPVILVDDIDERVLKFFSIFRAKQKAKVIMLTGSVGKTTTKDLCDVITKNHFKTFASPKNRNTVHLTAQFLFSGCDKDNDLYIQECGAGYVGSVRFASAILQPDIFILTNVYEHHLQIYKTYENLFGDKVSGDDYLKKDGIVITNYDDENIRKHQFKNRLITFAIDHEDADYRAINIKPFRDELSFDIFEKSTGNTTHIKVKMMGRHNIYNVLAAFILGKVLGLSDEEIREDLLEYRTEGLRQNLTNIGGTYINVDCYNVAEESVIAMLKAGEEFDLDPGNRRIALIGGENKLGDKVTSRSEAFGKKLAEVKMDEILFCGTKKKSIPALNKYGDAVGIKKSFDKVSNIPSKLSTETKHMVKFLEKNVKRGDLVMIKGIHWLNMAVAIDKFFGTSFSFDFSSYKEFTSKIKSKGYTASTIEMFGEAEIIDAPIKNGELVIPKKIEKLPVFRIKNAAFKENEEITKIDFGSSIKNIGARAFFKCHGLKEVQIPSNVRMIERGAFRQCRNLTIVTMAEGVTHISMNAFAGCKNLKEIHIPPTVGMIEDNAFKGCPEAVIICRENTFAHKFAIDNDIKFRLG